MNTPIAKDLAAATSTIQHITAHVVGNLIAQQLVDPTTDDMPYVWDMVEDAVDRAIDGIDLGDLTPAIEVRSAARLNRQIEQRAAWERQHTPKMTVEPTSDPSRRLSVEEQMVLAQMRAAPPATPATLDSSDTDIAD